MLKNVAGQKVVVYALSATTNLPLAGDAANITVYLSKDWGATTVLTDTSATELEATNAKGYYLVDLSQSESNADVLHFSAKSSTANTVVVAIPAVVFTRPPNFSTLSIDSNGRVDVIKIAGTTQTARDIGTSVLLSTGTGAGQLDFTSGVVKSNAVQLLGTAWLTPGTAGTPDVNVKLWNALTTVALPLVPTTAGRTLDVSAGGEAGLDWANIGSPTTTVALTGTTIAVTQKVDVDTIKTNPVVNAGTITFPTTATLASTTNITGGTIATVTNVTTVNGLASGVITAASIATDAIGAVELAADAITEIRSLASGTSDSGTTTTMVDAARTEADTDYWKGQVIVFTSGNIAGQARLITGFNAATDTITYAPATTQAAATQTYEIWPNSAVDVQQWLQTTVSTPTVAGVPNVNTKTWNDLTTVALPLVPTTAGRTLDVSVGGEAGLDWANIGSPTTTVALTGTTIAITQKVDVDTIKTNPVVNAGTITFPTTATLASTANITGGTITTVTNLTNAATNGDLTATMKASVNTEVDTALIDIRLDELLVADSDIDGVAPPAVGSVFHELMTKTAGSFTFDQTTDSLEAIRDRGDAAWTTATGFSTHTAADVWAAGTRTLTAGTNIQLPSNGLANITAWTVDITGSLSGAVGSVTGTIGGLTAAALKDFFDTDSTTTFASAVAGSVVKEIADNSGGASLTEIGIAAAVWQTAVPGNFTIASSIGKSLYTGGVVPGGTNGLFIAGTNAATAVTTALTTTFTGNLTGSVGSVATDGITSGSLAASAITEIQAGLSTLSAAQVNSEVDAALADIRLDELLAADSDIDGAQPPTVGSVFHELMTKTAGSFTFDQTTDSLEALRDRGDSAWATATGFSTHTAADIWTSGTRTLTAGTNIQLPSNGLANVTAWTVNITGSLSGSVGSVASGGITATSFGANAITSSILATDCIGAAQIAADAIGSSELATTAITEIQSGLSTLTAAQVNTEVDTALADVRLDELLAADSDIDGVAPPTVGSVFHELMTKTAGSFTFDQATDSLEAVRDRGDAAWTTATGFSTHTAADVWASATRTLTAGTNIQLPSNGLANVTAWTVNITGSLSGNVGGITGITFPSNFSALSITAGGLTDITQTAADKAWGTATRVLTAATNVTSTGVAVPITAGGLVSADATAISTSTAAADNQEAALLAIWKGSVTSAPTTTTFIDSSFTQTQTDHFKGRVVILNAGTLRYQAAIITAYNGTTKQLTFSTLTAAPSVSDTYVIL